MSFALSAVISSKLNTGINIAVQIIYICSDMLKSGMSIHLRNRFMSCIMADSVLSVCVCVHVCVCGVCIEY